MITMSRRTLQKKIHLGLIRQVTAINAAGRCKISIYGVIKWVKVT